jgi:hypothetical protein
LKRFEVIADNSYLNPCSYDQQSLQILLKRIFFGFFELSIFQSLATAFIFIFAALIQRKRQGYFSLKDSFSFFLTSATVLFLSSSFMSISLRSYSPMCLDPRHYLFLVPVAAIPASTIIVNYLESKRFALQIIIVLVFVTTVSFFLEGSAFWKLYLPMTILFSLYYLTRAGKRTQLLFIWLFLAILLLIPVEMGTYAKKVDYRMQRRIIKEKVLESRTDHLVISNEVQKRLLDYYSGFDSEQTARFFTYESFEPGSNPGDKTLLLLNGYTRYLSGLQQNDLPFYARNISPLNRLIFENSELDIYIYEMLEFVQPGESGILLLSTVNEFEKAEPYWKQKDQDLSEKVYYSGARSNKVARFSATFEYSLDSLYMLQSDDLLVQGELYCYAEKETSAKIVVSLETDEGTGFWKATEINRYLHAYSNWWPISFEASIRQEDLMRGSRLKVYVWKKDASDVYIDNFRVELRSLSVPE